MSEANWLDTDGRTAEITSGAAEFEVDIPASNYCDVLGLTSSMSNLLNNQRAGGRR
jgi:hypothetical protein